MNEIAWENKNKINQRGGKWTYVCPAIKVRMLRNLRYGLGGVALLV